MSRIGIAILSFAHGHVNAYCHQIARFADARLVAAWDDNLERGRSLAEQFGMMFSPHLEDILGRADVDAVIIASETNKHADLCVAAAAAGKAILLQKPMALTLADCDRIIAAVERTGVSFQMAFQMRCDPVNQKMVELVHGGTLGKIGVVRRRHCINFLFHPPTGPTAWHIDPTANMGMFMDDAVHAADFLYWLLGEPVSVMAEIDNVLTRVAPDDTGIALYRFSGGTMAILFNSSVILAGENTTEIYGDRGVLIQNHDDAVSTAMTTPHSVALRLYRRGQPATWMHFPFRIPRSHGDRIAAVPRPWIDMLQSGSAPACGAREGKVSVAMILGAYRSAAEGQRVNFPLD
ncbi:MAG: Gfo/Idh/MocA family oxidoreductase [Armatimonadetes bacterium]|nr:Gfo/Idh/MocA family oxidoreductase [Armatimonadota bacterium]